MPPRITSGGNATRVGGPHHSIRVGGRVVRSTHFDNAMAESFWARMRTELLNRKSWTSVVDLGLVVVDYIENFHNTSRRH